MPDINLYDDRPDLYDLLHDGYTVDLPFYAALVDLLSPEGGDALELGCGSGRVLASLRETGLSVTGLDSSTTMLERARRRLARFGAGVRLVHGDMRDLAASDLGEGRFDLIVVAINTFLHLDDHAAQRACLQGIRARLAPGGAAVIDVLNPFHALTLSQGALTLRRHLHDEARDMEVSVTGVFEVDPTVPRMTDRLYFDEWSAGGPVSRSTTRVDLRLLFMPELELLLASAGLGIADAYGDYDLGPYHATAERMIVVLRAYEDEMQAAPPSL